MARRGLFAALLLAGLAVATELLSLAALVLVLRVPFPAGATPAAGVAPAVRTDGANLVLHPYLGYVQQPEGPRAAGDAKYHGFPTSDFGFIDAASPLRKRAPDTLVLGITGGSVAYWFSARGIARLEADLAPLLAGRKLVVVRFALGGYKQPQQLLALNYLLALGAEFDVVLNLDGFNEVTLPSRGSHPSYPQGWSHLIGSVPDPEELSTIGEVALLARVQARIASAVTTSLARFSPTVTLVWTGLDRALSSRLDRRRRYLAALTPETRPGYAARGPAYRPASEDEARADLVRLWVRASCQMQALCRGNGIRYLHCLQPMGDAGQKVALGYSLLIASGPELARAGVDFADLSGLFARMNEPIFTDAGGHMNARGDELMAIEIARLLNRKH